MDYDNANKIRQCLESAYDIPFIVERQQYFNDSIYKVRPKHNNNELFDVSIRIKDQLRIIIEVLPQKYAAFSIIDMSDASDEKKAIFTDYAAELEHRKAKVDFSINGIPCDAFHYSNWPASWNSYRLRVSRSPICQENECFDEVEIVSSWALIIVGMVISLLNVVQTEGDSFDEGGVKRVTVNRYERNPINRELCLAANGYTCKICGFNFEAEYGELGHHFIHVHHIVPVSNMNGKYMINPVKDLIPVCPNCHAMLHRLDPPMLPEELRRILEISRNKLEAIL